MPFNLLTILGATASGKTRLAVELARRLGAEIISADSRQVYRGMNTGTGKDLEEYTGEGFSVPYHLIDIVDPGDEYDLYHFQKDFYRIFRELTGRGVLPVLAGGTGLYISSVVQGYKMAGAKLDGPEFEELMNEPFEKLKEEYLKLNPNPHNTTDLLEKERLVRALLIARESAKEAEPAQQVRPLILGIQPPRDELKQRISKRLRARLEAGMIDEVKGLLARGVTHEKLHFFGLEYRFVSQHLQGELNYNDMQQKLSSAIYQFARRQIKWYRRMERDGVTIHWLEEPYLEHALRILAQNRFDLQ